MWRTHSFCSCYQCVGLFLICLCSALHNLQFTVFFVVSNKMLLRRLGMPTLSCCCLICFLQHFASDYIILPSHSDVKQAQCIENIDNEFIYGILLVISICCCSPKLILWLDDCPTSWATATPEHPRLYRNNKGSVKRCSRDILTCINTVFLVDEQWRALVCVQCRLHMQLKQRWPVP